MSETSIDRAHVISLIDSTTDDVNFAKQVSDAIVQENTTELDAIMREIQANVVNVPYADDVTVSSYFLQLTNALYFLNARCEMFGFYEDITKANARLKYNEAYAENQLKHAADNKKPTQSDNQLYAEMQSVDEATLNMIYSRSVKIIKGKLDSASEMVRTLSKILSVRTSGINSMSKHNID